MCYIAIDSITNGQKWQIMHDNHYYDSLIKEIL